MSKKAKASKQKRKKSLNNGVSQTDRWLDLISQQLVDGDFKGVVVNCELLLNYLPERSPQRAEVLRQLGVAHGMLQNFEQSYVTFTKALELAPNDVQLWFNRGRSSRLTSRFGRSLRDYERAAELSTSEEVSQAVDEELKISREFVEGSLEMRGPNFTLDQLIEQEDLFHHGMELMQERKWEEAAQAFLASIALGDCLPQPWSNLGTTLAMQERYDEAESAWRRALVIDPEYTIAKENLATLPENRHNGPPATIAVNEPFRDSKLKQSIKFLVEE